MGSRRPVGGENIESARLGIGENCVKNSEVVFLTFYTKGQCAQWPIQSTLCARQQVRV